MRENVTFAHGDSLHFDQFLDQLVQLVAAEIELAAQGAHREPTLLFEDVARTLQSGNEAHTDRSRALEPGFFMRWQNLGKERNPRRTVLAVEAPLWGFVSRGASKLVSDAGSRRASCCICMGLVIAGR